MKVKRAAPKELMIYRIVFITLILITLGVTITGIVVLASDGIKTAAKRAGMNLVQALYLDSSSQQNHMFGYAAQNKNTGNTLFMEVADTISINYYASHQSFRVYDRNVEPSKKKDQLLYSDELIAENLDEEFRNIDEELNSLAIEENKAVISDSVVGSGKLEVEYTTGDVEMLPEYLAKQMKEENEAALGEEILSVSNFIKSQYSLEQLADYQYLISNFYIVDEKTSALPELFDASKLLSKQMGIDKSTKGPQILIYHTHASETYIDSKSGVEADTVVGAGNYLTTLLEGYGYKVYHDKTAYDRLSNGESNRNYAYSTALPSIQKILDENPTIEVVIDLHRDDGAKRVTTINGKDTARIMLFNGLCRNSDGPITRLENPNLEGNLAFSLQTALVGRKLYQGFFYKNYLKNYRYNMHLKEHSLLIECGTDENTVIEAYNAMEPLADVLNQVLGSHSEAENDLDTE